MLLQARIFYSPKKLFCGVLHTSWPVAQEQSSPGEILTKNLESDGSAQNFFTPGVRTLTHPEVWENRFTLNRFGSGGHPLGGHLVTASKLNHEPIRNVSFLSEPIKSRKKCRQYMQTSLQKLTTFKSHTCINAQCIANLTSIFTVASIAPKHHFSANKNPHFLKLF